MAGRIEMNNSERDISILLSPSNFEEATNIYKKSIDDFGWNPFAMEMWNTKAIRGVKDYQLMALVEMGWNGNQVSSYGGSCWMLFLSDRNSEISKKENFFRILKDIRSNFRLIYTSDDAMITWVAGLNFWLDSSNSEVNWEMECNGLKMMNFIKENDKRWPMWIERKQYCKKEIMDCMLSLAGVNDLKNVLSEICIGNLIIQKDEINTLELAVLKRDLNSIQGFVKAKSL